VLPAAAVTRIVGRDLPPSKHDKKAKNEANFNARAQYARIVGVDLVAVLGLSSGHVQTIITDERQLEL
jgi:hypothetical protein